MKKWRCRVCAYESEGAEPPAKCPVCGADSSFFSLIEPESPETPRQTPAQAPATTAGAAATAAPGKSGTLVAFAKKWLVRLHAHPISAHVPNGVLPVAVVFLFLGLLFDWPTVREAAFYNVVFVMATMPLVVCSGFLDWEVKLKKARTPLILGKIVCGGIVLFVGVGVIVWRIFDGEASARWSFFCAHLVMLGAAGVAGFLGGKLVFGRHQGLD